MAAARMVAGAFVALLCTGAVVGAVPAQLATWLVREKSAGLSIAASATSAPTNGAPGSTGNAAAGSIGITGGGSLVAVAAKGSSHKPKFGNCGITDQDMSPHACDHKPTGSWNATAVGITDLAGCVARCKTCSQCNYVSYNPSSQGDEPPDCSWYRTCDMTRLARGSFSEGGYTSEEVSSGPPPQRRSVHIDVAVDKALATTSDHFVCWNIDASANRGFFQRDLDVSKPYGKQLAYQAAKMVARQGMGMQRADAFSLLRFGGSGNDALLYEFGDTKCPKPDTPGKHFEGDVKCLNQTWWHNLMGFANASNARIIFGVSEPKWTGCGQGSTCGPDRKAPCQPCKPWDATNAREILAWTIAQGLDHLIYGLELGNEVDGMYTGAEQAKNLQILHKLTLELWPNTAKRPLLLGPDAAHQDTKHSKPPFPTPRDAYVYDFFKAAGEMDLPIAGATLHKYIEVTTERDTNASRLDETSARFSLFQAQVNNGWAASGSAKPPPRAWGGEVGPHNGGSPPCGHSSMRWATFADSLWFADALGSSAKLGFAALCRQDYIGADYGLLDCATGTPLPDYWTATLWTWMVGPTVLSATLTKATAELESGGDGFNLRVYAHCTAIDNGLGPVTLIVLNLGDEDVTASVVGGGNPLMWQLAPEDKAGPVGEGRGLNGTGITLNGHPLRLIANNTYPSSSWGPTGDLMPDLTQFLTHFDPDGVTLTPRSITFLTLDLMHNDTYPPACK